MENSNSNQWLIALVAIVAVVSIVTMTWMGRGSAPSSVYVPVGIDSVSNTIGGEAMRAPQQSSVYVLRSSLNIPASAYDDDSLQKSVDLFCTKSNDILLETDCIAYGNAPEFGKITPLKRSYFGPEAVKAGIVGGGCYAVPDVESKQYGYTIEAAIQCMRVK